MDEEQAFQPDAQFAVEAQQTEINELRGENIKLRDRLIYSDALVRHLRAEANAEIARLVGENSIKEAENARLLAEIELMKGETPEETQEVAPDQTTLEFADAKG
jgi:ribosome recycling factor